MHSLCTDPLGPCMSIGAMYAALGIHRCMPLSHGASGCCRFQRMEIARHFQRVVHVPSTMLNDRSAAYGGEDDLREAVGNVFDLYDPDVVLAFTTCLSETIGDDMRGMCERLELPPGRRVVWASTPSYAGSHLAGYDAAVAATITQLARCDTQRRADRLALVPGWCDPCDIDEMARIVSAFFPEATVLPDTRGVLDVRPPMDADAYPEGGTRLADIMGIGACGASLFVGHEATARARDSFERIAHGATTEQVGLPVGIGATDAFADALVRLRRQSGMGAEARTVAPSWLARDRQRAVDALLQQADLLYGLRVAIVCDADLALGLVSFAHDVGMEVLCIAPGECSPDFEERAHSAGVSQGCSVLLDVDRLDVEESLAKSGVDLVLGDSRNKRLAARLGAPLMRMGFPMTDRPLRHIDSYMGYTGALRLMRDVAGAVLDWRERGKQPHELAVARYF